MKGAVMKVSGRILLRKRNIIETISNELKNIAQVIYSERVSITNYLSALSLLNGRKVRTQIL